MKLNTRELAALRRNLGPVLDCYKVAFDFVVSNSGWTLVHGTVEWFNSPYFDEGAKYAHAWVVNEAGERRDIKEEMYAARARAPRAPRAMTRGGDKYTEEVRYTAIEARRYRQHGAGIGEFGPWHLFNGQISGGWVYQDGVLVARVVHRAEDSK